MVIVLEKIAAALFADPGPGGWGSTAASRKKEEAGLALGDRASRRFGGGRLYQGECLCVCRWCRSG